MPRPPVPATRPKRLMSPWLLLGLTLLVSLVHLFVLQGGMAALQHKPEPVAPPVLSTRTIQLAPPPAPSVATPAPPPKLAPAPRPRPAPAPGSTPKASTNPAPALMPTENIATNSVAASAPIADTVPPPAPPASASVAAVPPTDVPPAAPETIVPKLALPPPTLFKYQANLETRGLTNRARAELLWQHDGSSYNARLSVSHWLAGSRVQTSQGQLLADGLAPTRFSDKFRSEVAAHFERDKGTIVFSANTPSVALRPGMQDRLSVFIQLAALLAGEPERYPPGTTLVLPVVGPRDADEWRITVGNSERLALPAGPFETLKLVRPPQREFDQLFELWLAPALGYMPVRLRLTESNGDVADLRLSEHGAP